MLLGGNGSKRQQASMRAITKKRPMTDGEILESFQAFGKMG
jgi:hypothetical protein